MFLVPFHKGNGTGGTYGTRLADYFQGLPPIERTQWHFLVPLVPLVSHIPRNGTEQDAGIKADFVPHLYRFVSAVSCLIQAIQPIHGRLSLENVDDFCSICSACPTHSVERNGTRPMVWADRYGRSAPVTRESGQSQFAPLKLRSLALVPSSGAQSAPTNSTYGSSTVRLFLPRRSAPVRDSRSFRAPAPPVLMRGVSDGRNVLLVSGTVPLSGQPAAGLSPPCRCPCHRTPKAGKRLALESPLAPQGEDNRPGSVVPRSTESAENP